MTGWTIIGTKHEDKIQLRYAKLASFIQEKYQVFLENPLLSIKQPNLAIECQIGEKIDKRLFLGFLIKVAPIFFGFYSQKVKLKLVKHNYTRNKSSVKTELLP